MCTCKYYLYMKDGTSLHFVLCNIAFSALKLKHLAVNRRRQKLICASPDFAAAVYAIRVEYNPTCKPQKKIYLSVNVYHDLLYVCSSISRNCKGRILPILFLATWIAV